MASVALMDSGHANAPLSIQTARPVLISWQSCSRFFYENILAKDSKVLIHVSPISSTCSFLPTVTSELLFFSVVKLLVEKAPASSGTAVTVQLVAGIFDREFVVIGELFAAVDLPQRKNDDVLPALHVNNPRVTVGLTRVVNEARRIAVHGGVHYIKVINAEHVAANALEEATENVRKM